MNPQSDTLDKLLRVARDDHSSLPGVAEEAGQDITSVVAEGAVEAALSAIGVGDLAEAEAAFRVATLAYQRVGDPLATVDTGIRCAEVMKVRAETVDAYEFARLYALGMAGDARRLRQPELVFRAVFVAADSAYFAADTLQRARDFTGYRKWLLTVLDDCLGALDVVEAGQATPAFRGFVGLLTDTVGEVMGQHWFDTEEAGERSKVRTALRRIALMVESFVPFEASTQPDLLGTFRVAGTLAGLSYDSGSPDAGSQRLGTVIQMAADEADIPSFMAASAQRYEGERASLRTSDRLRTLRVEFRSAVEQFRALARSRAGRLWTAQQLDEMTGSMILDEFVSLVDRNVHDAFLAIEVNKARILLDEVSGIMCVLPELGLRSEVLRMETEVLHLEAGDASGPADAEFRLLSRLPVGGLRQGFAGPDVLTRLEQAYAANGAGFEGVGPITDLEHLVAALEPGEAMLSYHISYEPDDPAGTLLMLLVTTDGALPIHLPLLYEGELKLIGRIQADGKQPLDVSPLGNLIAMTRFGIQEGDDDSILADLQQLYRILIAPLEDYGIRPEQFTRLVIVPSGMLHAVPFAALQSQDGRFLVEQVPLVVAPSASVWEALSRRDAPAPTTFLGFADPSLPREYEPLPGAATEVATIAELLGGLDVDVRVGLAANETAFRRDAPGRDIVHLATHGEFPEEDVIDLHRILLTPVGDDDGRVHAEEVRRMDLSAAGLVVLSVCDGALYRFGPGDEPLGLMAAFLAAGARNVVGSLWAIDDGLGSELMIEFYRGLLAVGPAEALRRASIHMMGRGARIRDWAGFVLVGVGRPLESPRT